MLRIFLWIFVINLLSGCAALDSHDVFVRRFGNQAPADGILTPALRTEAFEFVWKQIDRHYVDAKFNGVDWQAIGQQYKPQILAASEDATFWTLLDHMVGELKDSHTSVISPERYADFKNKINKSNGVDLLVVNEQLHVASVATKSDAWQKGLRTGYRIIKINKEPAMQWWQRTVEHSRKGSTSQTRLIYANRAFKSGAGKETITLEFEDRAGQSITAEIGLAAKVSKPTVTTRRLDHGVAYIRLSAFSATLRSETLKLLEGMRDARGIILDLRNNPGGSVAFSKQLASMFVEGEKTVSVIKTRDDIPVTLFFGMLDLVGKEFILNGPKKPLTQPLVILINANSASASELLTAALRSVKRAYVIGEISCGCLLGVLPYANVPGGGAMRYSEAAYEFRDGTKVEGVGITPDEVIQPSVDALLDNRDIALERAVMWLNKVGL